jgi:hypothetical protein
MRIEGRIFMRMILCRMLVCSEREVEERVGRGNAFHLPNLARVWISFVSAR